MSGEILATGGYTDRILKEAADKEVAMHSRQMKLLSALIKTGAYRSIKQAFSAMTEEERRGALAKIEKIDSDFAVRLSARQEGTDSQR